MHLVLSVFFKNMNKPSVKTLGDHFRLLVKPRRDENKRNASASGIIEKREEKEELLNDLIEEVEKKAEDSRFEKN